MSIARLTNESDDYRGLRDELQAAQSALMGDEKGRGMDLLSPVWHFFDLTPEGRGNWFPGS